MQSGKCALTGEPASRPDWAQARPRWPPWLASRSEPGWGLCRARGSPRAPLASTCAPEQLGRRLSWLLGAQGLQQGPARPTKEGRWPAAGLRKGCRPGVTQSSQAVMGQGSPARLDAEVFRGLCSLGPLLGGRGAAAWGRPAQRLVSGPCEYAPRLQASAEPEPWSCGRQSRSVPRGGPRQPRLEARPPVCGRAGRAGPGPRRAVWGEAPPHRAGPAGFLREWFLAETQRQVFWNSWGPEPRLCVPTSIIPALPACPALSLGPQDGLGPTDLGLSRRGRNRGRGRRAPCCPRVWGSCSPHNSTSFLGG